MAGNTKQIVRVKVLAGARKESLQIGARGGFLVTVKDKPVQNRANERVRELVARHFHVPPSAVRLITGHHRRNKQLSVVS